MLSNWLQAMIYAPLALTAVASASKPEYTFSTLQTVPGTQFLENLAIRHTGDILVTSITSNILHQLSPKNPSPPIPVASTANISALLGIAELAKDIFYVAGGSLEKSDKVWKIDLRTFDGAGQPPARVELIAQVPEAQLFNGMAKLSADEILLSDSTAGTITKLNVHTGEYSIFVNDPSMKPIPTALNVGIDGLRILGGKAYYTSLDQGIFASIDLDFPSKPAEIIATGIVNGDDFAFSPDGRKAYIANNGAYMNTEVDLESGQKRLIRSSVLGQASSVAFGGDRLMYVTGSRKIGTNETIGMLAVGHAGR